MIHTQYYKRLAEKMACCRKTLFVALLVILIIASTLSAIPFYIQKILHAAFIEKNTYAIQAGFLAVMLLLIIRSLADYGNKYLSEKANNCLLKQLNADLFNTILNLPICRYQQLDKHLSTIKALTSIEEISRFTVHIITVLVRDILILFGLVAYLIWLDQDFALFIALLIPFAILMLQVMKGQRNAFLHAEKPLFTELVSHLRRSIDNFRHIRLYHGQQQEYRLLKQASHSLQKTIMQQANYSAFIQTLCQLVLALIIVAISYLMMQQAVRSQFSIDLLGAYVAAILLMMAPISRLADLPRISRNAQKDLDQIFLLLDQHTVDRHDKPAIPATKGGLSFESASFYSSVPERSLQYTFDLKIKPGEIVALVCQSRPERALLIDILLGFKKPSTGKILLDNIPYEAMEHADLLAHFAMVSNKPVILNSTVANNIAYGLTECANEASITAVAHIARASRFVREMPDGLQTRVDENGASMTRHQWQKVEVARALLKNSPVVIIDNLWLQPNRPLLNEALMTLIQNRTVIVLLQTIPATEEHIDRIFLLNNGAVTEK